MGCFDHGRKHCKPQRVMMRPSTTPLVQHRCVDCTGVSAIPHVHLPARRHTLLHSRSVPGWSDDFDTDGSILGSPLVVWHD